MGLDGDYCPHHFSLYEERAHLCEKCDYRLERTILPQSRRCTHYVWSNKCRITNWKRRWFIEPARNVTFVLCMFPIAIFAICILTPLYWLGEKIEDLWLWLK